MAITVFKEHCPQNHQCPAVRACPMEALTQKAGAAPEVDPEKCTDCGLCTKYCLTGALQLMD
ncbi:MAG: ATP-binding protein [Armatimonadota bacterium]